MVRLKKANSPRKPGKIPGVIGGIFSTAVLAVVYETFGLRAGADVVTDYEVLRDMAVREPIVTWSIIIALAASVLSALPFIFCRMTSAKHDSIIEQLKAKAGKAGVSNEA